MDNQLKGRLTADAGLLGDLDSDAQSLVGSLNSIDPEIFGDLTPTSQRVEGNLNIFTMETGDGRELELAVVNGYICWRRVYDAQWIQLVHLENLRGNPPVKGVDYWTEEDKQMILRYTAEHFAEEIPHDHLIGRDTDNQHPISSITGLQDKLEELDAIIEDKTFTYIQSSASPEWVIHHNLDKYPSVSVVDSADTVMVGDIQYIDKDNLIVRFSSPFSGKAFIN